MALAGTIHIIYKVHLTVASGYTRYSLTVSAHTTGARTPVGNMKPVTMVLAVAVHSTVLEPGTILVRVFVTDIKQ